MKRNEIGVFTGDYVSDDKLSWKKIFFWFVLFIIITFVFSQVVWSWFMILGYCK